MNLTKCYAKDAQLAFDNQANNLAKKAALEFKEPYQMVKRIHNEMKNV